MDQVIGSVVISVGLFTMVFGVEANFQQHNTVKTSFAPEESVTLSF